MFALPIRKFAECFLSAAARRPDGLVFFIRRLRRLTQIFGGLSCRCAAIHAAGFFRRWRQINADTKNPADTSASAGFLTFAY
jgi:hypothetical protein